ncbi:MAG TPA: hypothetical protein VML91_00230 [Burkholderiales bacterium]|nr:hypothetical protein [Burkholderiales bacterium]
MPVRQMKLRFDAAKPTSRVIPSLLVPESPQAGKEIGGKRGNKKAYGALTSEPLLGAAALPPPSAAEAPPAVGGG